MESEGNMGKYGYCHACGETFLPKREKASERTFQEEKHAIVEEKPISFIDVEIVKKTFHCFAENNFVKYLLTIFEEKELLRLINEYHIGTSRKVWYNQSIQGYSTIFYQIDIEENDLDENGYKSFENRVADLKLMKINAKLLDLYPEITHNPQHPNYKNDVTDLIIYK